MSIYDEDVAFAHEMINESGRLVTLQRLGSPVNGQPVILETLLVMAAFLSTRASESNWGNAFLSEDFVKKYAHMALIAGRMDDRDLLEFHSVKDTSGQEYRLDDAQVLKPGDKAILYAVGVS